MKNKIKNSRKILLLVLMLALAVCALAVTAFAADEATSGEGSSTAAPAYYSYEFASDKPADEYPLAIFEDKGNDVYSFVKLYTAAEWDKAVGAAADKAKSVIFLRDNVIPTNTGDVRLHAKQSKITLDLNDKVLEKQGEPYLFLVNCNNSLTDVELTIKNGTMKHSCTTSRAWRGFIQYNYAKSHTVNDAEFDITFENVKFEDVRTTDNGGKGNNFIFSMAQDGSGTTGVRQTKGTVVFNDCELYPASVEHIFNSSDGSNNIDMTFIMNGGKIETSADISEKLIKIGSGDAVIFGKGSDGNYTELVYTNGATYSGTLTVNDETGAKRAFTKKSQDGTTTVYSLTATETTTAEVTAYGTINYTSSQEPSALPVAVFVKNGSSYVVRGLYSTWKTAFNDALLSENSVVYLRADITPADESTFVNGKRANVVVDLNQKTINKYNKKYVLEANCDAMATDVKVTFKNGKMVHSNESDPWRGFVQYGAKTSHTSENARIDYTFDNVTLIDNRTGKKADDNDFIVSLANLSDSDDDITNDLGTVMAKIKGNIVFNNCTFQLNDLTYFETMFYAKDAYSKIDLVYSINGGKIVSTAEIIANKLAKTDESGDSVTFGKYNGTYTEFVYPNTVTLAEKLLVNDDKGVQLELAFRGAEGENNVYELTIPAIEEETKYGKISYTDKTPKAYPLAVFKNNGDGTYTLVDLYTTWAAAANAALGIDNSVVYFRDDFTSTSANSADVYLNDKQVSITVDLNGKTLTREHERYLMDLSVKATVTDTHVTFKNGTLRQTCNSGKSWRGFFSYNYETSHTVQDANVDYTFENVIFEDEGTADCQFIFSVAENGKSAAGVKQTIGEIVFNDCKFYLGLSKFVFNSNDSAANVDMKFTVNGGRIYSDTDITPNRLTSFSSEGDSLTFGKGTDGKYTEFVYPSTVTMSDTIAVTDDAGTMRILKKLADEDANTVYELAVVEVTEFTETTPYGDIVYKLGEGGAVYPFAIFAPDATSATGYTLVTVQNTWNNAFTEAVKYNNCVVYLRVDFTLATSDGKFTVLKDNSVSITVDLGGHTLGKTENLLFSNYIGNKEIKTLVTFKNGSMVQVSTAGNRAFINYDYASNKTGISQMDYVFENVKFYDERTKTSDNFIFTISENDGSFTTAKGEIKGTITYNNCEFYANGSYIFDASAGNSNDVIDLTIIVNGGKIISSSDINPDRLIRINTAGDSVTFGAYEGKYTEFVYPNTVTPAGTIVVTDDNGATRALDLENKVADGDNYVYQLVKVEIEVITETTVYGDINYTYEKPELYPLVVFKNNGDGTYTFVDFYETWLAAVNAVKSMRSSVIYFRADVARPAGEGAPQFKSGEHSILVDLNGKTLTKSDKLIFDLFMNEKTTDIDITFMNGTMVQSSCNDDWRAFIQYNYGEGHTTADAYVDFTFNGVTFKDERTDGRYFIIAVAEDGTKKGGTNLKEIYGNIIFNDCVIYQPEYLENSGNKSSLFEAYWDQDASKVDLKYVMNGGKIVLTSVSSLDQMIKFNLGAETEEDSLRFGPNKDGEYTKLVLSGGENIYTAFKNLKDGSTYILYSTEGRDLAFVYDSAAGEYSLKVNCHDDDRNHVCDVCSVELSKCADNDTNHKCDYCNAKLSDCADMNNDHKCEYCDEVMSECADANNNHFCDVCNKELSKCVDGNNDHNCDICGKELSKCVDENKDHNCDICGAKSDCTDANNDHLCDLCGEKASDCADVNNDHDCDLCGKENITECADDDNDHDCDVCGETLTVCLDYDKDHNCDLCEVKMNDCADNDKNHKCDVCGKSLSVCGDNDKDHKCDVCGVALSECDDKNKDHKCDLCGKTISECEDDNNDHNCDICRKKISACADVTEKDHNCDVCGKVLSECDDANNDHVCDVCGIKGLCIDVDGDGTCDVCGISLGSGADDTAAEGEKTIVTTVTDWFKNLIAKIKDIFANLVGTVKTKVSDVTGKK